MNRLLVAAVGSALAASACGTGSPQALGPGGVGPGSPAGPGPTASAAASRTGGVARPSRPPAAAPAVFHAEVHRIGAAARARMIPGAWRPGCPVSPEELRVLILNHWGFDGRVRRGRLVVNGDAVPAVLGAFRALFAARFPIRGMRPIEAFGGSDERSMAADNTSGFNCRLATGSPSGWSEHAYGRAIDINPVENPYVDAGTVEPAAGMSYVDRRVQAPGVIHRGDTVVRAFAAVGWGWGGSWSAIKDYQHFSETGR